MGNYYIKKNDSHKFEVMERSTEQSIGVFADYKSAQEMSKKLNNGAGFDGWTPTFFLKNINNSI